MGSGVSMSRVDNRSQYTTSHRYECAGHDITDTLYPGREHHRNDGYHRVTHTISVTDSKGRLIKKLRFWSGNDNQWEIRNHGVVLIRQWDHSKEIGTSRYMNWDLDHEEMYNNQDREEENRRRQEEQRRREEENRRRQEEERQRRENEERRKREEAERRRQEEERRKREEEERRRQEEERRRQEEERRRREEEERRRREEEKRQQNVDRERSDAIAKEKRDQDLSESELKKQEIAREMEEKRQMEIVKQQKSAGWSAASKIETKKQMGDIKIGTNKIVAPELTDDEMRRIRSFCELLLAVQNSDNKSAGLLKALNVLDITDLDDAPEEILFTIYHHILNIRKSSLIFNDSSKTLKIITRLFVKITSNEIVDLETEADREEYNAILDDAEEVVKERLINLPVISADESEESLLTKSTAAFEIIAEAEGGYPLETFRFYFGKISEIQNPPDQVLLAILEIISLNQNKALVKDIQLVNFILRVKPTSKELKTTQMDILVMCLQNGVESKELLEFFEGIILDDKSTLAMTKITAVQYLSNLAAINSCHMNQSYKLLEPLCQMMNQIHANKDDEIHSILIVLDSILTVTAMNEGQKSILEKSVAHVINGKSMIAIKYACDWYLNDKIGFLEPLKNRLLEMLQDQEYKSFVSSFFHDMAEKNVKDLPEEFTLFGDIFEINGSRSKSAWQLDLHVKLAILLQRLEDKIEVENLVMVSIIQTFKAAHNLSFDSESIDYCLQIFSTVIATEFDSVMGLDFKSLNLDNGWMNAYLDHEVPEIRTSAFRLLTVLMEKHKLEKLDWEMYVSTALKIFQNWQSIEEHRFASEYLVTVIPMIMANEEEIIALKVISENIVEDCVPSANAEHAELRKDAISVALVWIDSLLANSKFTDEDLTKIYKQLTTAPNYCLHLLRNILSHILAMNGHDLCVQCIDLLKVLAESGDIFPFEVDKLTDLQTFLKLPDIERSLKETLLLEVIGKGIGTTTPIGQYHKISGKWVHALLSTIGILVEHGNPEIVKLFSEACSKFAVRIRLAQDSILKILSILEDPRFKMSIRLSASKTLCYVVRNDKTILDNIPQFSSGILYMLREADMRIYGLFTLCHVAELPENRSEIIKQIQTIHSQALKMAAVVKDPSAEESTILRLCEFLLRKFCGNQNLENPGENFNWMIEWLSIPTHADDLAYVLKDQAKYARWLLRQESMELVRQGHNIKIDLAIAKIETCLHSGNFNQLSTAESTLDRILKHCQMHKIEERVQDLQILKGDIFMAQGSFKGAIKIFKEMNHTGILAKIARAHLGLGLYDRAAKMFESLPSNHRQGFGIGIHICEKSMALFDVLRNLTGSKALARAQLKGFHTKIGMATSNIKEVNDMLGFLVDRGEYYDLSVIATMDASRWKIEFLAREIFNRTTGTSENKNWPEFYESFKALEKFHGGELQGILHSLLNLQKRDGRLMGIDQILEVMFFLLTPDSHSTQRCLDEGQSQKLCSIWLKQKFVPVELTQLEIETFWAEVKNLKTSCSESDYSNMPLSFIERMVDLTKHSNSFIDICNFIRFLQEQRVPLSELQVLLGNLILQEIETKSGTISSAEIVSQKPAGIQLVQYQKNYVKQRFVNEIFEILKVDPEPSEDLKAVVMETAKLFDEGICQGEEAKEFLKYLIGLGNNEQQAGIERFFAAMAVDKAYKNVDIRPKIFDIIKQTESDAWKEELRECCLGELLESAGNEDKTVAQLVQEYKSDNKNDANFNFEELEPFVQGIQTAMSSESTLGLAPGIPINQWDNEMIATWSAVVKKYFAQKNPMTQILLLECFAVIQTAMFLFQSYHLRQVGVMALSLLLSSEDKGCLAKIGTGEGKSGLVAALAVLKALQGHTVDVVTNSSVLAQRDCSEWSPFFKMFELTAMENSGIQEKPHVAKECYNQNIVYGDASAFQGDVLRHEFSLLGTRGSRKFDIVIVDEVDSMFIDGSNHSTRLIDKMPQMDYLEPIFAAIWQNVGCVSSTLIPIEGQTFAIGEVCGYAKDLIGCVVKALGGKKKMLENSKHKSIESASVLQQSISIFCEQMRKEELADIKFRRQVVNRLQDKSLEKSLRPDTRSMLSEMKSLKDVKENSGVVDSYIHDKWNVSEPKGLLHILEIYLDINIVIIANVDESLHPSPNFHEDGLLENPTHKDSIRFFQGGNEFFELNFVENPALYVARKVEDAIRKTVESSSRISSKPGECKLVLPAHLYELFSTKLDEWVQSAIQAAFALEENKNYVLRPNDMDSWVTITPVDFENTGVTQQSSVWGEGLHQFLQMKHKLKISPEYLATNFISNMSFFRRFDKSIYGLTGTLGDENEVSLLQDLYNVKTLSVPTFKPKRLLQLGSVLAEEVNQWKTEILNSAAWEIASGRVVLIICKTIEDVKDLKAFLVTKLKELSGLSSEIDYRLYFRSDDASSEASISGRMGKGTVVISTNLAGRGTNIKLAKEVIQAGGLHVIITFLPTNLRVEEQAVGRAARNGEPGTSQIILNLETEHKFTPSLGDEATIENMKKERGNIESQRVDKIRNGLAKELEIEERQFKKFCDLKGKIQQGRNVDPKKPDHILNGIGERWAVELETTKTRTDVLNWEKIDRDFDGFFSNLNLEVSAGNAIRNPSYYILQGNLHLIAESKKEQKAIELFTKAINLDLVFTQHAYYNRAFAKINQAKDGYKEDAKADLTSARNIINEHILPLLSAMHGMVDNKELKQSSVDDTKATTFKAAKEDNDFTKQMVQKINFNYLQIKSIDEAIEKIEGSKRDVVAKFGDIKEFYDKNEAEIDYADINEMEDNGFIRFMYVEEKPAPWWDIFAVFLLGILQCVAGACLCLIGAVNIGMGLVAEGVSDFIVGITAAVTGEFSWTDYLKNKALSIGVSLLMAGAGVALKAISALPKVATLINAVKNSALVTKTVAFGKSIGTAIKGVGNFIWKGTKSIASSTWSGIKTAANKMYTAFTNFGPVKWLTNTRPWIYSKNALNKAFTFIKDTSKTVWQKGKDIHSKIFGTKNLNPETYSNLKSAGQIVAREILSAGLMEGFDRAVLNAVGNAVEERIRSDTEAFLRKELLGTTDTSKKLHRILESCMGKKMDVQISNSMRKSMEEDSGFDLRDIYRTIVSSTASAIFDELRSNKKATGWVALGMHLIDHVTSLISNSVTIGETIKELTAKLPELLKNLSEHLGTIETHIKTHDHSSPTLCNGGAIPVDPRDIERTITSYCTTWSSQFASQMRSLIMANLVKPQAKISFDQVNNMFTKKGDFNTFLEDKGLHNRNKIVGNVPKFAPFFNFFGLPTDDPRKVKPNSKPPQNPGDTDIPAPEPDDPPSTKPKPPSGDLGPEPAGDGDIGGKPKPPSGDMGPEPITEDVENKQTTEKPKRHAEDSVLPDLAVDELLRLSSSHLDAAIELFLETEDGLKYVKSLGQSKSNGNKYESVLIVSKTSDEGVQTFSRLSTSNGELRLMEFPVHTREQENGSLLAAITSSRSGSCDYSKMELKLAEFSVATEPRPIKGFSLGKSFSEGIDKRIVMCTYVQ